MDKWKPGKFLISVWSGPEEVRGFVYRGLGMRMQMKASPKGRRPPMWGVWHLSTGHRVRTIDAQDDLAKIIATELAELTDWEAFDSLRGWENTDPELPEKVRAIDAKYPGKTQRGSGSSNEADAVQIATARAG